MKVVGLARARSRRLLVCTFDLERREPPPPSPGHAILLTISQFKDLETPTPYRYIRSLEPDPSIVPSHNISTL